METIIGLTVSDRPSENCRNDLENLVINSIASVKKKYFVAEEIYDILTKLISEGKTKECFEILETYFNKVNNKTALKELLLLSSQFSQTEKEYRLNFITGEEKSVSQSKTNMAILSIIEK